MLVAELVALVEERYVLYTFSHALGELMGTRLSLTLYTVSQSLYGLYISLAHNTQRCQQIDSAVILDADGQTNIAYIIKILDRQNPANGLGKQIRRSGALTEVIEKNLPRTDGPKLGTQS